MRSISAHSNSSLRLTISSTFFFTTGIWQTKLSLPVSSFSINQSMLSKFIVIVSCRPSTTMKKLSSSPLMNSTVQGWCLIVPSLTAAYLLSIPSAALLSIIQFFIKVSFCAISIDSFSWPIILLLISSMISLRHSTSSRARYDSVISLSISFFCSSCTNSYLFFS